MDFRYDEHEEQQKLLREVTLKDQDGDLFYKKLHFSFLQMPLFNKQEHELETRSDKWLFFLKNLARRFGVQTPTISQQQRNYVGLSVQPTRAITVDPGTGVSKIGSGGVGNSTGIFYAGSDTAWTGGHEAGHLLGLIDHYKNDAKGISIADQGWGKNIMGAVGGVVEERNIEEILLIDKFIDLRSGDDAFREQFTPTDPNDDC